MPEKCGGHNIETLNDPSEMFCSVGEGEGGGLRVVLLPSACPHKVGLISGL